MAQVKGTAVQSFFRYVYYAGDGWHEGPPPGPLALGIHRGDAVCRFEGNWE